MESFEYMGYWWIPGRSENKVSGRLSFGPTSGGSLELRLEERFHTTQFEGGMYPLILGVANATEYTLTNCMIIDGYRSQTRHFSAQERVFAVDSIFEGNHFHSIDDLEFDYLAANYTYLDDWMDQRNFHVEDGSIRYEWTEPIILRLVGKSISFGADIAERISRTEVAMKEACWVKVTPATALHFRKYRHLIDIQLPNFLSLATGAPNYPSHVETEVKKDDALKQVKVYYMVPGFTNKQRSMPVEHMMFTLEDVKICPSMYLSNWISKAAELQSVYDLYHQSIYSRLMHFHTRFLLLSQALEAYHRNLYDEQYMPKYRYKQSIKCLKNSIPDCIQGELRSNLHANINRSNDFSLKSRIVQICDKILPAYMVNGTIAVVDSLIGDSDKFAENIKATRNYLTHRPKTRSQKVLCDEEIVDYIPKMLLLLRICLLVELGCPPEKINEQVNSNPEFNRILGRW